MGNHRFRLSNIIPNSWFHPSNTGNQVKNKLTKTQPITTSSSSSSVSSVPSSQPTIDQRKSYYFTRELNIPDPNTTRIQDPLPPETRQPDPRRRSMKKKRPISPKKPIRRKLVSPEVDPSAAARCCRITPESVSIDTDSGEVFSDNEILLHEKPTLGCSCRKSSLNEEIYANVDLPRIITKQVKQDEFGSGKWVVDKGARSLSVRVVKEGIVGGPVRKVKGGGYSPRLGNRVKVNGINGGRRRHGNRRSLLESLAVVKTTADPRRDFKESMLEMIVENNIKSSKDMEELLACYLALNSDEYHDLIIKVFKEIWFECTDIRL